MTAELRSIYSGPIRRALDRGNRVTLDLETRVAALEAALAAATARIAALEVSDAD
jgi:uncharacterized protein YceH (UPF0502 family)